MKDLLLPATIGFNYHSVPSDNVPFIDCFGNVGRNHFPPCPTFCDTKMYHIYYLEVLLKLMFLALKTYITGKI